MKRTFCDGCGKELGGACVPRMPIGDYDFCARPDGWTCVEAWAKRRGVRYRESVAQFLAGAPKEEPPA